MITVTTKVDAGCNGRHCYHNEGNSAFHPIDFKCCNCGGKANGKEVMVPPRGHGKWHPDTISKIIPPDPKTEPYFD